MVVDPLRSQIVVFVELTVYLIDPCCKPRNEDLVSHMAADA